MSSAPFFYRAFGLAIASALEIPQLPTVDPTADIDLRIGLGAVDPTRVTRPGLRRGTVRSLFRHQSIDGREVTIESVAGADPRDIADMIVSRVMAIVLYQRGRLPLHASAVIAGGGIVAFSGASGSGKSTLAAAMAARGHQIASDDMLAVDAFDGQPPRAWPGATRLKLSRPTLEYLGQSPDGLPLANTKEDKLLVGAARADHAAWQEGLPLRALVLLGRGAPAVTRLRPVEAMAQWRSFVRSTDLFPVAERPAAIWQQWVDLAGVVPVLALDQPGRFDELPRVAALVDEALMRDNS